MKSTTMTGDADINVGDYQIAISPAILNNIAAINKKATAIPSLVLSFAQYQSQE